MSELTTPQKLDELNHAEDPAELGSVLPPLPEDWQPVDLAELLDPSRPRARPTVLKTPDGHGLFYRGRVNEIHGASGSGKSWAALAAAWQVIHDGGRVLWIDVHETPADSFADRLRMLSLKDPQAEWVGKLDYVAPDATPLGRTAQSALRRSLDTARPELVVMDSMTGFMTMHELDSMRREDVQKAHTMLKVLMSAGAAVLVIDHTNHGQANGRATGNERKTGAITGAAYSVRSVREMTPQSGGRISLTLTRDRDGGVKEWAGPIEGSTGPTAVIVFDPVGDEDTPRLSPRVETGRAHAVAGKAAANDYQERVLAAIQSTPDLTSRNQIAKAVKGNRSKVQTAIRELADEGRLIFTRGKPVELISHPSPPPG